MHPEIFLYLVTSGFLLLPANTQDVSIQQVYLQPFNSANVECSDGSVIDGRDRVVMVGSVTADGTSPLTFDFKKSVSSYFSRDCTINVDVDGCFSQSTSSCYCKERSGNNYTVVYNSTADIGDSGATLRLSYQSLVSDQQLPIVHGVEHVSVTVVGGRSKILSNVCHQAFELGNTYDFKICGENFVSAEFYIGTDANIGPWKTAVNSCASVSVAIETMTSLTFAYRETQGCQRQYTTSCTVMAKPELPRCDPPTLTPDNTALSVTCSTDKVYPQAQCDFHRHGFSSDTEITESMKEIMYNYQENSGTYISKAFSAIFSRFECCAVTNYSYDFQIGNSTSHTRGFVFAPERPSDYTKFYIIPITCCRGFDYKAELTPTIFMEHDLCLTRPNSTNAYISSCFDKIKDDTIELGRILLDIGETTLVYEGDRSDVSYTHESYNSSDGLIYYKSTCTLTYPVNTPGSYAFFVDMFVNISSTPYGLQQSSVSDSFNLTLPEVGLATDCFSGDNVKDGYIKTGTTATCKCDRVQDGFPVGQVQWYNTAGQEVGAIEDGGMSATLTVYANGTEQNFTCKGKSVLGVQATGVSSGLKVADQATVETFTANQNQTLTVDLHDSINLTCVVDGNPPPIIIIEDHRGTDQKSVEGHRLTYVKDNVTCTDTAVYTCQATSFPSMNESSVAQVEVFVRCPQQPQNEDNTTFSATEGDSVTLDLDVIGYPAPRSYTLRQGQTVVAQVDTADGNGDSGTYQFKYESNDPPLGTVQLTIGNLSKEHFTNYLLTVDNGVGQAVEFSFILETATSVTADWQTSNTTTTTAPTTSVQRYYQCHVDSVDLAIPVSVVPNSKLHLKESSCQLQNNGTHHVLSFGYHECGTSVAYYTDYVYATNDITVESTLPPNGLVVFADDYTIPLECRFHHEQFVNGAFQAVAIDSTILGRRGGADAADFILREFRTELYQDVITEYPAQIPLNKELFVEIALANANGGTTGIVVKECKATPSNDDKDNNSYTLIQDGCPAQPTVQLQPNPHNEIFRFSLQAFHFADPVNQNNMVYLHCDVSICPVTSCTSNCAATKRRRRRSIAQLVDTVTVSSGPYLLV